ncbi:hypothetical protein CLAFUW4_04735 [Fulvia fulva]|uniref:Uncharacterized protein n=1 Tax=Passalora fulva TaxID=5499 RepID=A0A9Q8LI32_PASFU|nr:uncharacterized protein CLAFUR5_04694 [Fulvia fulva]KAK4627318.1 hypothetical protein CLAFUR4_04721 [Fulvia fulva]KAK4627425.1 hypothetical protein CLAFUR0_04725 [Fulvia fulva]UJO17018.1 hypothetical protein CLAFUR5_04694 [Fulvia fulva]WPV14241.1 hypothetical protein CLAFUW4_04735 [Fulvia fulva]WPV28773.1 hypothetical protein CLAFUW7_04729 [Fulvia fulva]
MHTPTVLLMTLAGSTLASPLLERNAQCSDAFRSSITTGLARYLQQLETKDGVKTLVSLFGLPYLPVGLDESTTDIEGPLIRQVLYKTDPRNNPPTTNSANGTSSIALDVTVGPRVVPLPVGANALVPSISTSPIARLRPSVST